RASGSTQHLAGAGPEFEAILQAIEATVDMPRDAVELTAVGQRVKPVRVPEPGSRLGGPTRLLEQLRQLQQTLVAKQRHAAGAVVVAPCNLDQPPAAVPLTVAVRLRRVAQAQGQGAGVVTGQVAIAAQLLHVTQVA